MNTNIKTKIYYIWQLLQMCFQLHYSVLYVKYRSCIRFINMCILNCSHPSFSPFLWLFFPDSSPIHNPQGFILKLFSPFLEMSSSDKFQLLLLKPEYFIDLLNISLQPGALNWISMCYLLLPQLRNRKNEFLFLVTTNMLQHLNSPCVNLAR